MPALRRAPHLSGALVTPSTRRTPRSADSREWRKSAHEAERLADPIKDGGVPQRFAAIRGRTTGKSWAHVRDSATASPSRASRCVEAKCSRKRDALVSIGGHASEQSDVSVGCQALPRSLARARTALSAPTIDCRRPTVAISEASSATARRRRATGPRIRSTRSIYCRPLSILDLT